MNNILTVIGTRPEAIKLFPVIAVFKNNKYFKNKVCVTSQDTSLLDNLLLDMNIEIDYKIASRENGSCLNKSAAHILLQLNDILIDSKPDLIIVQGDTTSAFIAALAGFYLQIPIAHIEAGLRTDDIYSPWPEEVHRCFIDKISNYFFTPTKQAEINLIKEGVKPNSIWTVGNTSIDSVRIIKDRLYNGKFEVLPSSRFILITLHRRENHGEALEEICSALRVIAEQFLDIKIIFCLHPNPYVSDHVKNH